MDWTVCIRMDWLILILGVPAILIPLVLLFGFAGCGRLAGHCTDDSDCPVGNNASMDRVLMPALPATSSPRLSRPGNLAAIAIDDRSVSLTWTNNDPAATDFQIERARGRRRPSADFPIGTYFPRRHNG